MTPIDGTLWILSGLYAIVVCLLSLSLALYRMNRSPATPFLSVIVAARNEEAQIGSCLEHVAGQSYPPGQYEIIIIDDRSEDATPQIVAALQEQIKNLKLIRITDVSQEMAPKKRALDQGIRAAKGDIIVCTDADCRPEKEWLRTMASGFADDVGLVVGFSPLSPRKGIRDRFLALDALALACIAAGSSVYSKPWTATGRSLAYRKAAYLEVGGFSKISDVPSGDDDLLLSLIRRTRWKMGYAIGHEALVYTDPPDSLEKMVHQKMRQASKIRSYNLLTATGLVVFYGYNLGLGVYIPWILTSSGFSWMWAGHWVLKSVCDLLLLSIGAQRFGVRRILGIFPLAELLYPWYVIVFGALGTFGKYSWKGARR